MNSLGFPHLFQAENRARNGFVDSDDEGMGFPNGSGLSGLLTRRKSFKQNQQEK
jgi:hypothetical protein